MDDDDWEVLDVPDGYSEGGSVIRESADCLYRVAICNTSYNFTTNMLKTHLSAQASSLSAFVISKTHISGQKPRGRQLNAEVCGSESAIFRILCSDYYVQQQYLTNGLSIHRHFSMKLMLITAQSSTTTQRLHITLVKSHSRHSVVAVRCEGHHFLILYACAQVVSFPSQIPCSLVWERLGCCTM